MTPSAATVLVPRGVDELRLVDARDYRRARVDLVFALIERLRRDRVRFLVPARPLGWDRVAFLNLGFWTPGGGELLPSRRVSIDELTHVAWHHLARRRLGVRSADALLLGEAIASAFDAYLIGALLRGTPRAAYLTTQIPRLSERARDAGLDRRAFERRLAWIADDPERAFEALRALLYDAARTLLPHRDVARAHRALARFARHPLAPLLHHYELSNWLLAARGLGRRASPRAATLDDWLRRAPAPLTGLTRRWLVP